MSPRSTAARSVTEDYLDVSETSAVQTAAAAAASPLVAAVVSFRVVVDRAKARISAEVHLTTAVETPLKPLIRLSGGSAPRYLKRGGTAAGASHIKPKKGNEVKAKDALIAWTPQSWIDESSAGGVRVLDRQVVFGDDGLARYQWDKPYQMTDGAVSASWSKLRGMALVAAVLRVFNTLVVRDGLKPDVVHDAFLAIDEYATSIDPDTRGARDPDPD